MSASSLRLELADHIYHYLCHEALHSDLPEAAKESLTAASECIEQAYRLNASNTNHHHHQHQHQHPHQHQHQHQHQPTSPNATSQSKQPQKSLAADTSSSSAAASASAAAAAAAAAAAPSSPDELLRIFTRHKEFLLQQHQQQNQQNESSSSSGSSKHRSHLGRHHRHMSLSVHQKNFKRKLIALIKKFRTDGSNFDSEEQYREALERELMKAAAGRGSREIEELLEEEIDAEGESGSEPDDWDNISESSTPKPSLRPFFSSTTLDKI